MLVSIATIIGFLVLGIAVAILFIAFTANPPPSAMLVAQEKKPLADMTMAGLVAAFLGVILGRLNLQADPEAVGQIAAWFVNNLQSVLVSAGIGWTALAANKEKAEPAAQAVRQMLPWGKGK